MAKKAAGLSRQERLAKLTEKIKNTDTGGGGGQGFWSPKEGRNVIRILPEVKGMEYFYQTVGRHNFPPDGKKTCYCPRFTSENELPCPVCESVDELYKAGGESKELAGQLRVRKMYWMNVIVRGKDGADTGPFVYTPGVKVFNKIATLINDPDYGDIMDVEEGIDLILERTGSGLDTEYEVTPRRNSSPLATDQETIDKYLEEARNLTWVELSDDKTEDKELSEGHAIFVLPYDRLVRELDLEGTGDEEEEDEPVPVAKKPVAKAAAVPSRKAAVVEDEDEDDEDEDDEDEDDNPPAPAKKTAKAEVATRTARRPIRR